MTAQTHVTGIHQHMQVNFLLQIYIGNTSKPDDITSGNKKRFILVPLLKERIEQLTKTLNACLLQLAVSLSSQPPLGAVIWAVTVYIFLS